MRGVLLDNATAVDHLVDVTHELPRGDVRVAAFWLAQLLPWFPPAVHLAVVDPGVGSARGAVVVRAGDHAIVAPDNGLALPAARAIVREDHRIPARDADPDIALGSDSEAPVEVFAYEYSSPASNTFHGRDVFAPAAAAVHEVGVGAIETLEEVQAPEAYVDVRFAAPEIDDAGLTARILAIDDFGNAITNVPGGRLPDREKIRVGGETVPLVTFYGQTPTGQRLVTVGSHNNAELAVHDGRGDEAFDVSVGDTVRLAW